MRSAKNPRGPASSTNDSSGSLDDFSGHGTFIAGLVRQTCPDADLVMVKAMGADGFVSETTMINALDGLAIDHVTGKRRLDAVSMSFGYYFETGDEDKTASLFGALKNLSDRGVVLVASAGNDATTRPMFPAAFSATIDQLISVGARNPNGTVALFSNAGDWVRTYWLGCPDPEHRTHDLRRVPPADRPHGVGRAERESLDLDDFSAGSCPPGPGGTISSPRRLRDLVRHIVRCPRLPGVLPGAMLRSGPEAPADLAEVVRDVADRFRR